MSQYTCAKHPGLPLHHDGCDGHGVSWGTVPLKTNEERLRNSLFGTELTEEEVPLLMDALLAHKLREAIQFIESDHESFLAYLKAELARFPCMHAEGGHEKTPPMMWPELIACIRQKAYWQGGIEALAGVTNYIQLATEAGQHLSGRGNPNAVHSDEARDPQVQGEVLPPPG